MFHDASHMTLAGWVWTALFWAVLLGLLSAAAIGRVRSNDDDDGRAILDRRLARGEIRVGEYDTLRTRLERVP